jgi:hypothetical protein
MEEWYVMGRAVSMRMMVHNWESLIEGEMPPKPRVSGGAVKAL